jgi:hypothetical protein
MDKPALRFRSDRFRIDPTEDEETNPFLYGRSLAEWLRSKLASLGYTPEEVIPEDYGWIVVLSRGSGMLWVACVNEHHHLYEQITQETKSSYVPDAEPVTWTVWVNIANPMWSLNIPKRRARIAELERQATAVACQLFPIIQAEPGVETLEEHAV